MRTMRKHIWAALRNTPQRLGTALAFCMAVALLPLTSIAGGLYTDWRPSLPAPDIDDSVAGGCPIEARDGLALYTARAGGSDIYANERASIDDPFGPAEILPAPVNTLDFREFCPSPAGGEYLLFVSTRNGGCGIDGDGTGDIYIVRRGAADGWGEPRNLGCAADGSGPNTTGSEFSPSLLETRHGTYLYFSSDVGGDQDIYKSRMRRDGSFGPPVPVRELNTEYDDRMPTVSSDGKEIVFSSNRPTWGNGWDAAGGQDVYIARRGNPRARWSHPANLSVLAGFSTQAADETRASLSWDGLRLYYGSGGEIYMSERRRRGH